MVRVWAEHYYDENWRLRKCQETFKMKQTQKPLNSLYWLFSKFKNETRTVTILSSIYTMTFIVQNLRQDNFLKQILHLFLLKRIYSTIAFINFLK